MKKSLLAVLILVAAIKISAQTAHADPVTLSIGAKAPNFKLPGIDDKKYSLANFADKKVLVVIFSCNHCPTAQAYEDRIISLTRDYASRGVGVVVISPNNPDAINLGELGYTDLSDDMNDMKIRAKDKSFNFPYLYDGDAQATSVAYGPVATPHVFVFDSKRILRYNGRLDESEKPGTANAEDARAAIDAVLNNKDIAKPVTKTFGCSIKWKSKTEYNEQLYKKWAALPVNLETADLDAVKKLISNSESGKLRLVNIWATWCAPCVQELPEFVKMDRMYRERDFEFLTISLDDIAKKDKAVERLKKLEASNKNYIFTGTNKYPFIEAIDPKWQGALPYTLLIEPGGKILYGRQGPIDPLQLKKAIVDSKYIGRYY
ncbi:MAG TPA: redoxin family protein [Flavitalea sp.]|nr:redoxin family protein [Flavitalea sp.]